MLITFGFYLDGAEWSAKPASLGEIVCGPLQLLQVLEERLGLSRAETSPPVRIDEYARKIALAIPDWCRASYQLDRWSTAKQLLAWRDELLENGWDGATGGSPRLEALAAIETKLQPFPPGRPERLRTLLFALKGKTFTGTLLLREPVEQMPPLWRQLVEILRSCGMQIIEAEEPETIPPEVIRVDAPDEMTLALQLARYLKSGDNTKVAVICEGDSHIVDGILRRFGFGALGVSEPSRWRESLQILPLWLENLWKPFNPQRFMELLQLSHSPIPYSVKPYLINALKNEPGMGGEKWEEAWRKAKESGKADEAQLDSLRKLLEEERFSDNATVADAGVPEETLRKRCDDLAELLKSRIGNKTVLSQIKTLKTLSEKTGLINRVKLARMLDLAVGSGTADDSEREVNPFAVFTHPGMVSGDFDTVLWWNFIDRGAEKETWWSEEERKVVSGIDHTRLRQRESLAWRNARSQAKQQLILFIPKRLRGENVTPHPLLDELTAKGIELIDEKGNWSLGDRKMLLKECTPKLPPPIPLIHEDPPPVPWRALSYTQLSRLLACPYQWFLLDYLNLRPPDSELPAEKPMLGLLAHKVVEELFKVSKAWSPEEAGREAGTLFDEFGLKIAAPLYLPGRGVELQRFRETLIGAIKVLIGKINELKLAVIGTEVKQDGAWEGRPFTGAVDILLSTSDDSPFVIDLKWSASKHYAEDLEAGKALQLATYIRLLSPEFKGGAAYFLFPKKNFIYDPDQPWCELWGKAEETWRLRRDQMAAGVVERGFSKEKELKDSELPLALTAYCPNCDCAMLCDRTEE